MGGFLSSAHLESKWAMNVTGPAPIAIVQRYDNSDLVLRLNQRIAAEVLQVSGDRVVLSVNGVQLVARLTSSDQAAQLLERRMAQFVVRDLTSTMMTLQIVPRGAEGETAAGNQPAGLIQTLLEQANIPVTAANVLIARALVNAGLMVNADILEEIQKTLEQIPRWGELEAQIAASLKAAKLPATADTIALVRQQIPSLSELIRSLQRQLSRYIASNPPPEILQLAQNSLDWLEALLVKLNPQTDSLAEQIQFAMRYLGRSLEHELSQAFHKLQLGQTDQLDKDVLGLALLRRELQKNNPSSALGQEIDRFLEGLRIQQFLNSEPDPSSAKGQWLRMVLPVNIGGVANQNSPYAQKLYNAEIKIAYLPDEVPPKIDTSHTRFVVQMELEQGIIAVDVCIAQKKIGVQVLTSNQKLLQGAEEELDTLKEAVTNLGYQIQSARCELSDLQADDVVEMNRWRNLHEVRLEV